MIKYDYSSWNQITELVNELQDVRIWLEKTLICRIFRIFQHNPLIRDIFFFGRYIFLPLFKNNLSENINYHFFGDSFVNLRRDPSLNSLSMCSKDAPHNVASILVIPKEAWTTVCPHPHIMAWVSSIRKLDALYTNEMVAELSAPNVRGIMNPMRNISKE